MQVLRSHLARNLGPVNAGTTFFLDGTVNLFILAALLTGVFGFPADIVFGRIIPGAAVAIVVGNVLVGWDVRRMRANGRDRMTAIPIGLDIATTFLMVFLVLGPVYAAGVDALGSREAALSAWRVGMAVTLWIGVGKIALSLLGERVQALLPNAAVLGTLSGVALTWMGAEPLLGIFEQAEVGLFALAIIIISLMAGHRLPGNLPGAFVAVALGTAAYLIIARLGISPAYTVPEASAASPTLPRFTLGGLTESFDGGTQYFGIVLPLTLFAGIGAVNIVRSAVVVGDAFSTRRVMAIDGIATLASALGGGVVQTVPYLGHTTYKRMGGTTWYATGAALVILGLSVLGLIEFAATYIPNAVLKGILIVVAADIVRVSLGAVRPSQAPAYILAVIPAVFAYMFSKLELMYNAADGVVGDLGGTWAEIAGTDVVAGYQLLGVISRGAILTALLLGATVSWVILRQYRKAAAAVAVAAVFTSIGLIHSVLPTSAIYFPWAVPEAGGAEAWVPRLVMAYAVMAIVFLAYSFYPERDGVMGDLDITDAGYE